jgi:hypothetical protein
MAVVACQGLLFAAGMSRTGRVATIERQRAADRKRKRAERADLRARLAPTTEQAYSAVTEALAFVLATTRMVSSPAIPVGQVIAVAREILVRRHHCDVDESKAAIKRALSDRPAFRRSGHVPTMSSGPAAPTGQ